MTKGLEVYKVAEDKERKVGSTAWKCGAGINPK